MRRREALARAEALGRRDREAAAGLSSPSAAG